MPRITLLHTHTHAGDILVAGQILTVDEPTATWLIARGIGQLTSEDPATATTAAPTPPHQE